MLHTLLLNSTYECIAFISERKLFKLLAKDKIEVLEAWSDDVNFGVNSSIKHPAVVRLIRHVRWIPRKLRFNRAGVFKRDQYVCQYCSAALTPSKLTLDHIIPRARGGDSSWKNCVTACFYCNNKKGNRLPEEAGMQLIQKPIVPQLSMASELRILKLKHDSWFEYIPNANNHL